MKQKKVLTDVPEEADGVFFFLKREKEKSGKRGGLIHRYAYDTDNVYLCVNGVRRCVCAD